MLSKKIFGALGTYALLNFAFAAETVQVDLTDSMRTVTHVASGSLYGITKDLPLDINKFVKPLKPNSFCQPSHASNGNQHNNGAGAFDISPRLEGTTGKIQITLADEFPGWPYKFSNMNDWLDRVKNIIAERQAARVQNFDGYVIWNEPYGTFINQNNNGKTENDYYDLWKKTYDVIRELDPKQKIVGPSFSYFNSQRVENFIKFCVQNNCLPDVFSWHQWGSGGIPGSVSAYRDFEKKYNITPKAISINEYSSSEHLEEGCPGVSVPFIAKFERHGVESAMISWWHTKYPGRLGSLLTPQNERGGGWWLYKWYGDMEGYMARTTPPKDNSDKVDAFANVNRKNKTASVVVGGNTLGDINVDIKIPALLTNKVKVDIEYVTWKDKDSPVDTTTFISSDEYNVNSGKISVPIKIENVNYAYRILLKAALPPVPQGPYNDIAATIPGKIEAENFDVCGEACAYHDNTAENKMGAYREDDGVDIEAVENGFAVGHTETGEWLLYTINVEKEGDYNIVAHVSTGMDTAAFKLLIGEKELGEFIVAKTGDDWSVYKDLELNKIHLDAGKQVLKLLITKAFVNIDYLNITEFSEDDKTSIVKLNVASSNSHYAIFDLNGTFIGNIFAKTIADVKNNVSEKVKANGVYFIKNLKTNKLTKVNIVE